MTRSKDPHWPLTHTHTHTHTPTYRMARLQGTGKPSAAGAQLHTNIGILLAFTGTRRYFRSHARTHTRTHAHTHAHTHTCQATCSAYRMICGLWSQLWHPIIPWSLLKQELSINQLQLSINLFDHSQKNVLPTVDNRLIVSVIFLSQEV